MKQLTGRITISKVSGNDKNPVYIQIDDVASGCRLLQVNLTLEDFARAVLGQGWIPCSLEANLTGPIGMKAENKEETVPFDCFESGSRLEKNISKALLPFEVDGWKARRQDMTNGHCRTSDGQRVTFFRHVNPENGEPVL